MSCNGLFHHNGALRIKFKYVCHFTPHPARLGFRRRDFYKKLQSLYLSHPKEFGKILTLQVKELRVMSINIPWLEVLKACYPNAGIAEETEIIVVSPQYTADIAVIMSTTDRYDSGIL